MASFVADTRCEGHDGVLSGYVEAPNADQAARIMTIFMRQRGYTVMNSTAYAIKKIPLDCAYLNAEGNFMSALIDR